MNASCRAPQPCAEAALLRVEQVSFHYGSRRALDQVAFTLAPGTFHALLGPNGAGKSTLFALISRLYPLQRGSITLNGTSLSASPASVLQQIGMVFQQSTLDLDLSVAENLLYHGALHGIPRRDCRQRVAAELARLEITDVAGTRVRALNGGHRRRVEIARALLHQPRLLLLDEPTVGLDSHSRRALNRHVRHLCSASDVCVLWATHLIEEVESTDRVILLHQGRVRADASCQALCRTGNHASLTEAFEHLTESIPHASAAP